MPHSRTRFYIEIGIVVALCSLAIVAPTPAVDLVGYLPYYRMSSSYNANVLPSQLPMLDEIRYFGLTAASNGAVAPLDGSGNLSAHMNRIEVIKDAIDLLPAADRPRLNITLGGAGEAAGFATIAASASLRDTFAQEIEALLDLTGATSVDIDWEHPVGTTQFNNYKTMLQQIKQEVGAGRRVLATIDPTIGLSPTVLDGAAGIDGISLMAYDLSWWANDPSDFNRGEHSLPVYVEDAYEAWTQPPGSFNQRPWVFGSWGRNMPAERLGVGLPFYGRVIGTPQAPQGGAAYTYSELVAGGTVTDADGNYYTYVGQPVWTAGPKIAEQRVEFAHDHSLAHIIIWEIAQDLPPSNPNSLLRRAYQKNLSLIAMLGDYDGDHDVDADDYDVWAESFGLAGDLPADGNGDGMVDAADYVIWRDAMSTGGAGSGAGAASFAVPEAANSALILIAGSIFAARRQLFKR